MPEIINTFFLSLKAVYLLYSKFSKMNNQRIGEGEKKITQVVAHFVLIPAIKIFIQAGGAGDSF